MQGTVVKSTGSWYIVRGENQTLYNCRIQGKFRIKGLKTTNPIAVGDLVTFEIEDGNGIISAISPRKNYIIRKSTNLSKQSQIIASNIDLLVLVTTISNPKVAPGFLDRVLVTAEAYHIPVLLVINKCDLYGEKEQDRLAEILATYHPIGYNYVLTSTASGKGIPKLKDLLKDKTVLFSGQSGVGKSSLINALNPQLDLKIGAISDFNEKGQHTTTFAEMHDVTERIAVIDTPGVRSFGVVDLDTKELSHYFPEMRERINACKFNNCQHINEPKCAIKSAVELGEIAASRYENYLAIYESGNTETTFS